jgi:hypothetical protein
MYATKMTAQIPTKLYLDNKYAYYFSQKNPRIRYPLPQLQDIRSIFSYSYNRVSDLSKHSRPVQNRSHQ